MVKKFMRVPAVCAAMQWSRSTLYAEIAAGRFPKPCHPSPGVSAWTEDEVAEKQAQVIAARDADKIAA